MGSKDNKCVCVCVCVWGGGGGGGGGRGTKTVNVPFLIPQRALISALFYHSARA